MVFYGDYIVSKSEDLLLFFILKMSYNYFTLCEGIWKLYSEKKSVMLQHRIE